MEGIKRVSLLLACLSLLLFVGCKGKGQEKSEVSAEESAEKPQDVDKFIEAFGKVKVERVHSVNLGFPAEVEKLHVKKGQRVSKGDKLVTLGMGEYHKLINSKEYNLLEAEVDVKKLSAESYKSNSGVARLKKKKYDNLLFELNELKRQKLKENIVDNVLVCDIENGIISDVGYSEGDIVTSEHVLITIIDESSRIVEADVPEEFINDISYGSPVTITPVSDPKLEYSGKVVRISSIATERNGETVITVDIEVDDMRGDSLNTNYNVDVKIYER